MRFIYKLLMIAPATTLFSLSGQKEAKAWMKFCNRTDTTIWTAYAYTVNLEAIRVGGWWKIAPGECKTPRAGSAIETHTRNGQEYTGFHFFYAYSARGDRWDGVTNLCVKGESFDVNQGFDWLAGPSQGSRSGRCSGRWYKQGLRRMEDPSEANYTLNIR